MNHQSCSNSNRELKHSFSESNSHKIHGRKLHRKVFDKYARSSQKYADDQDDSDEYLPESHSSGRFDMKSFRHNSNQANSNPGSWSGVMGGGASKLQALQKWFKGESFDGRDQLKKKSDFSELAAVSVRDLVRAIGGSQESKGNGNGAISPTMSRSTSPVSSSNSMIANIFQHAGKLNHFRFLHLFPEQSNYTNGSKSLDTTETSYSMGSVGKDNAEDQSLPMERNSPVSSQFSSNAFPDWPSNSQSQSSFYQKSPADGLFSNSNVDKDKEKITFVNETAPRMTTMEMNDLTNKSTAFPKRALPSCLAESFRAVFAAFMWHEGLVHDAMACSSFLKFHPSMPKQSALLVTKGSAEPKEVLLSREQRAQQRYSVEVANAGSYLNIRPSTLETLTKSSESSIQNRKYRKNVGEVSLASLAPLSTASQLII